MAKKKLDHATLNGRMLNPSDFLSAEEMDKDKTYPYTIAQVKIEQVKTEDGLEQKAVILLKETPKKWILNRTNEHALCRLFGKDAAKWVGKQVVVFPKSGNYFGQQGWAIRVKGAGTQVQTEPDPAPEPEPAKPQTVKEVFLAAVLSWTGLSEKEDVADAIRAVKAKCGIEGNASDEQMDEMLKFIEQQREQGVDFLEAVSVEE